MTQESLNLISAISGIATSLTLIATIITVWVAISQMKKQSKLTKAANHIELRNMFTAENRFTVHANLRPGGDWNGNGLGPETQFDWLIVEDYLGLFENCEKMLRDKVLDKELFERSYLYRLKNIVANEKILSKKINNTNEDWTLFKSLMKRYGL